MNELATETVLEYLERKRIEFDTNLESETAEGKTDSRFYLAGIIGGLEIACARIELEEQR